MIENTKDIDELEFINSFSHSGKPVKDLSRIKALLSDLGDPQDSLKFVHIAGTNGKGSMAQMFSEVFQCAGLRTGLFTSPYIISYTDRIKINGTGSHNGSRFLRVRKLTDCRMSDILTAEPVTGPRNPGRIERGRFSFILPAQSRARASGS